MHHSIHPTEKDESLRRVKDGETTAIMVEWPLCGRHSVTVLSETALLGICSQSSLGGFETFGERPAGESRKAS